MVNDMKEKIIICVCRWRKLIPTDRVEKLVEKAKEEGREVEIVDDLCALLQDGDPAILSQLTGKAIAACHERAVKSLLAWRGVDAGQLINLREGIADPGPGNDAWYPVIDKDRCTECGKCFDFCPFGVYEMVDDRIRVVHPKSCKNNCPACARNCPSGAIIFPKYGRSPINGGTEQEEQAFRVDHSQMYADAFRTRLMERRNAGTPLFKGKGNK
ncbi:MAG: 4Fe-4S dicluster domain-containing protein [Prevotella sp.]|nr:4Fe-4S dicluster domain-containing protein [Prevotella sp.]